MTGFHGADEDSFCRRTAPRLCEEAYAEIFKSAVTS